MKKLLIEQSGEKGIGGIDIIGPAPAFIHKLRGKNRWQLVLRGTDLSAFLKPVELSRGWTVDIDPMGMIQ